MPETPQYDYAKLPDGSYAKFPKGTPPDVMRQRLTAAGLLKSQPSQAATAQAAPAAVSPSPSPTTPQKSFGERVLNILGQGVETTMDTPKRMMQRGAELHQQATGLQGRLTAPLRAESEEVTNALKGIWQSTAPGMIGQPPEQKVAGAIGMMAGAGEGGGPVGEAIKGTARKAGAPAAITMQELAGAGKEPVLLEAI